MALPTKKIPQLTAYGTPLNGTEMLEIWAVSLSRRITARDFLLPNVDAVVTAVDQTANLPASRFLAAGVGVQLTDHGAGHALTIDIIGTGALPANPSALVGLTAVNGVAATWMRSDSAPALDQGITPTWTAQHAFTLSGAANAAVFVTSAQPQVDWNETDGAANNRRWRQEVQGEQFLFRTVNDLNSAAVTWMAVDRTLNVVDTIALTSTALTWNGNPLSTAVGANPSASVGLAAVNGAAATFMRSDAAPALSVAIVPTWTGIHTFGAAYRGTRTALATGANQALDLALGNCFYCTLGGNTAFTFTNPPVAGREMTVTIFLQQDGTGTRIPTWPASVHWSDGITPVLTTTINRLDAVTLTTVDGGVTYYGGQVLANIVP